MYVYRKIETHSWNNICSGEAVSITYPEAVFVALGMQHAMSMRHILSLPVTCLAVQYFPHYLINGTILGKKLLNIKCVF